MANSSSTKNQHHPAKSGHHTQASHAHAGDTHGKAAASTHDPVASKTTTAHPVAVDKTAGGHDVSGSVTETTLASSAVHAASTGTAPAATAATDPVHVSAPAPGAAAPASGGHMMLGVNISGGEFGKVGDAYGYGYIYPSHSEIDYYASKGMDVIRVPFDWERLQHTKFGALDSAELSRLDDVVHYAGSKGLHVDLDMHNYGTGFGSLVGSSGTPNDAFADVWGKIAGHYAGDGNVMFGLMNEPHVQSAQDWLGSVNAAVSAIRSAGAHGQTILVPGTGWDGAWTWTTGSNASVIGTGVKDPDHHFAFEVHQYFDTWSTGTTTDVVSPTIGSERLAAVTAWAEQTHNKLFLGEFGAGSDAKSLAALDDMLGSMAKHQDAWMGATYWAGGPWWGNYAFSVEPHNGVDAAQMGVLQHHAELLA